MFCTYRVGWGVRRVSTAAVISTAASPFCRHRFPVKAQQPAASPGEAIGTSASTQMDYEQLC